MDAGIAAEAAGLFALTVALDGSVPDEELLELIDHSYELVVARLTKDAKPPFGASVG